MSKTFSILIAIIAFTGFLAGQILFKDIQLKAKPATLKESKAAIYESAFKDFKAHSLEGQSIDLEKIKSPVIILNFWASWCIPCLEEFPSLVKLKNKYSDDEVFVVGINNDMENIEKNISKIYEKYKLNFPSVLDNNTWSDKFKIMSLPASIIFINGKFHFESTDAMNFMDIEFIQSIDTVLKR